MLEPTSSANIKGMRKQKSSNKPINYKATTDDNFFTSSSALARNGDYAMKKDTWQKVELQYKNRKPPSPVVAISGASISSDNDFMFEEEKYLSSGLNWGKEDKGFINRLLSASKRK